MVVLASMQRARVNMATLMTPRFRRMRAPKRRSLMLQRSVLGHVHGEAPSAFKKVAISIDLVIVNSLNLDSVFNDTLSSSGATLPVRLQVAVHKG